MDAAAINTFQAGIGDQLNQKIMRRVVPAGTSLWQVTKAMPPK